MFLTFYLTGGHRLFTILPGDLVEAYRRDPITFGIAVEDLLAQSRIYVTKDRAEKDIYIRPDRVVAWEVEERGSLG